MPTTTSLLQKLCFINAAAVITTLTCYTNFLLIAVNFIIPFKAAMVRTMHKNMLLCKSGLKPKHYGERLYPPESAFITF